MADKKAETIKKERDTRHDKLANWRSYWQDLAEFCLPRKAFVTRPRTRGERYNFRRVFDTTAIRSLRIMAAGFHSNLTNPSSKWFNLQTRDIGYMDDKSVKEWFKEVEDIMFTTFNTTNFDTTMHEFYSNAGAFGTGVVFIQEDEENDITFTLLAPESVILEEDTAERIKRIWVTFKYTAQQAHDLWGDNAGKVVATAMKNGKEETEMDFVLRVTPRAEREEGKEDSENMPFESVWIEASECHVIGEGGFQEFPFAVGRFYKENNEVQGYSPAMDVLADIFLASSSKRTIIRGAMKATDPALQAPSRGYMLPLNLNPGAMNYRSPKTNADALQAIESSGRVDIGMDFLESIKSDIEKGFFVPLFQAFNQLDKHTMTVPEVMRRIAENMVLLGPVVGRFTQEMLDVLVLRSFAIMNRLGKLPEAPDIIQGQELDVVYVSPLAKAQRLSEIQDVEAFLANIAGIAQFKPDVLDLIDSDKVGRDIANIRRINPEYIKSDKDVNDERTRRAEAQMAQMKADQLQQGAETLKTGAAAAKDLREDK